MEETTVTAAKTCLHCGEPVGKGRIDKKYCSEACKSEQHNQDKRKKREESQPAEELSVPEFISGINEVLLANRNLLDDFLGSKSTCGIKMREADGRGFRFKFFTSCDITKAGEEYYFCYDIGYKEVASKRMVIVRRAREATY